MPTIEEASELHKEWRAIVLAKLNSLEVGQQVNSKDLNELKITVARMSDQSAELNTLREKVERLESFKAKIVGALIAANAIGGVVGWFISTFFRH